MFENVKTLWSMKETEKSFPSKILYRVIQVSEGRILRCLRYLQSREKALFS